MSNNGTTTPMPTPIPIPVWSVPDEAAFSWVAEGLADSVTDADDELVAVVADDCAVEDAEVVEDVDEVNRSASAVNNGPVVQQF